WQSRVRRLDRKRRLIDIRLPNQMPSKIANVGDFAEDSRRQLVLNADAEVHRVRHLQIRIDRVYRIEWRKRRRLSATGIGQIAVPKWRGCRGGGKVQRRKDEVPLGPNKKHPDPASYRCLSIIGRRPGKADSWRNHMRVVIESARRSRRHREDVRAIS